MQDSPSAIDDKSVEQDQQIDKDSSTLENQDSVNTEDSSTSEPKSTLDLIKAAVEPKKGEDNSKGSSEEDNSKEDETEGDKKSEKKSDEELSDEPTEEELKAWKPKTRKRFEQLQEKYRTVKQQLEQSEVDAGYYRQFVDFLSSNKLSQEEANILFDAGAAIKNDPERALQIITPVYNQLLQITGHILPADLKEQVEKGYITHEAAVEISTGRARSQNQTIQAQNHQQTQRQQEVSRQQKFSTDVQGALANLEQSWKKSDPDYGIKQARVEDRVKLMWYEAKRTGKMPRTVDEAVKMVEEVKNNIDKEYKSFLPPKKQVRSVDGGNSGSSNQPQPKNTLDVIRNTLGQ